MIAGPPVSSIWADAPSLPALLAARGTGTGSDKLAWRLIDRTTEVTDQASFAELYQRSCGVAQKLSEQGVGSGDVVVLLTDSRLEFLYALFGTMLCGAVPAAIYPPLDLRRMDASLAHIGRVLSSLDAAAVATTSQLFGVAREARGRQRARIVVLEDIAPGTDAGLPDPAAFELDAPALLQYTSGSLGNPKAVELSTRAIFANLSAIGDVFAVRDGDAGLSWLPLYHDMGLHSVFFGLMFRFPALLMSPYDFLRRPASWLQAISRYGVTHSPAPNFGYAYATRRVRERDLEDVDLSRWRVAMCGAEPIQAATLERFAERFASSGFSPAALMPAYGLAENVVGVSFSRSGLEVFDADPTALGEDHAEPATAGGIPVVSVGTPLPGHEVRIVAQGNATADGEVGEVEIRGPSHMLAYRDEPTATAETFDGEWLRTGDRGFIANGRLHITGRQKDLIVRAGKNYYPQDIEHAATVDGIADGCVAAFAVADETADTEGVVVVAEVRGNRDLDALEQNVRTAVRKDVGISLTDVRLVERGVVPKTTSGKIQRAECKRRYESDDLTLTAETAKTKLARIGMWAVMPGFLKKVLARF